MDDLAFKTLAVLHRQARPPPGSIEAMIPKPAHKSKLVHVIHASRCRCRGRAIQGG